MEVQPEWIAHLERGETSPVEIYRPVWLGARSFSLLATAEDRDTFDSFAEGLEEEEVKEKVQEFAVAFDVVDECGGEEDESKRAECLGEFLDHEEEHARTKALHELARISGEAAGPVLAEALETEDREFQVEVATTAYRSPSPDVSDAIDAILESEADPRDDEVRAAHHQLRMLQAWLHHNLEG